MGRRRLLPGRLPRRLLAPVSRGRRRCRPWTLLCRLGVDPARRGVGEAIGLVAENCRWEYDGQAFFDGEVEPCINGRTLAIGAYFGIEVSTASSERLLGEQLDDGGWNCEAENGSVRSSFHTTLCVLDGLLAARAGHRRAGGVVGCRAAAGATCWTAALLPAASTGDRSTPTSCSFSFPTWWHYDVLRALDYFRAVGGTPDPALGEGSALVRSKQQPDGSWLSENTHPGAVHLTMGEGDGRPSRWNTLRALGCCAGPRRGSPRPRRADEDESAAGGRRVSDRTAQPADLGCVRRPGRAAQRGLGRLLVHLVPLLPRSARTPELGNAEFKRALVERGVAHAALVFDGDEAVAWAEYGTVAELPNIHHRKQWETETEQRADFRITCLFVDRRYRRKGMAGTRRPRCAGADRRRRRGSGRGLSARRATGQEDFVLVPLQRDPDDVRASSASTTSGRKARATA